MPGSNLLALWPAFLILTPVLPITVSFLFLCPALLQTGNWMHMSKGGNGVIWTVSICDYNPWTSCNPELPGMEPAAESILSGLAWPSPLPAQPLSYCPNTMPANPILRHARNRPQSWSKGFEVKSFTDTTAVFVCFTKLTNVAWEQIKLKSFECDALRRYKLYFPAILPMFHLLYSQGTTPRWINLVLMYFLWRGEENDSGILR